MASTPTPPEERPATAENRAPWWGKILDRLLSRESFIFLIVALGMYFVYYYANAKGGVNQGIWTTDYARGLITLLFSVGTIVIAVVLILTAVFNEGTETEAKARFDRAKEVLTLLIGVFGTIVGFYFGSAGRDQGGTGLDRSTPAAIQAVGGVKRGDVVFLDGPDVLDTGLDALKAAPDAAGVVLDNSQVTDAGLKRLGGMKSLRWVSVRGVKGVTAEGIAELKKAIPNVLVIQ